MKINHLLRTLLLSCVFCLISNIGEAQWISLPDTNFGTWLDTSGFSSCIQGNNTIGWQLDTTCPALASAGDINCSNSNIRDLTGIYYFNSSSLECVGNLLTFLPPLPPNLLFMSCQNNQLTYITSFPQALGNFGCDHNNLTSLPDLPLGLTRLYCSANPLRSLPVLPSGLTDLWCYSDSLSALPTLPASLSYCYAGNNPITEFPSTAVTSNMHLEIDLSNCQLVSLDALPDTLYSLNISDNPTLRCFPPNKFIQALGAINTGVTCLPDYNFTNSANVMYTFGILPLCSELNPNNCTFSRSIDGHVYYDAATNCNFDSGDSTINNIKVQLYQNGILKEAHNSFFHGNYSFSLKDSTYQYSIDTTNLPFALSCPDTGYYTSVITVEHQVDSAMNFGLRCKPGFDVVAQGIAGRFVPGNTRPITVTAGDFTNFYGAHCAAGTSGTVQLIINGAAHYSSAASGALTPTVSNDTITWNIPDFGAVDFFNAFNINVATDTTAVLGSHICFTLIVNPIAGDNNPANNILSHCFTVVGSFDPNEKEVYPAGNIDTATKWLTYTIHFQNTGTAEAQHIYVTDTLDNNIDAASFQLLAYSHQPNVQLKGNNLRFNFPNINLPDSNTSEPLSHGYVQYKVRLKDNLPLGTNITNTAFIYFDFNAPVITNTVGNTISNLTGVTSIRNPNSEIRIFPNPATNSVTFSIDETMLGSNLTITDITGRQVAAVQLSSTRQQLSIASFAPGLYFASIETKQGKATRKLIKQ